MYLCRAELPGLKKNNIKFIYSEEAERFFKITHFGFDREEFLIWI